MAHIEDKRYCSACAAQFCLVCETTCPRCQSIHVSGFTPDQYRMQAIHDQQRAYRLLVKQAARTTRIALAELDASTRLDAARPSS